MAAITPFSPPPSHLLNRAAPPPLVNKKLLLSMLQSCIDANDIEQGRRIHGAIRGSRDVDPFVETKLVSMYAKCGSLDDARKVLDDMRERNLFAWSAMVGGYARDLRWEETVCLFFRMVGEDGIIPDGLLLAKLLQACANIEDLETGRLLHSFAVRKGLLLDRPEDIHIANSVLTMYIKSGEMSAAKLFFSKMQMRDVVSWNSMISGHCQFGEREMAVQLFELMRDQNHIPVVVTWNILIGSYCKSGELDKAMEHVKQMKDSGMHPDIFTWNSLISGFVQSGKDKEALNVLLEMQHSGVDPNDMTIASALSACASSKMHCWGMELHSLAIRSGSVRNLLVMNSLIDNYAKCGRLEDAEKVFASMREKDVFSWNTMIAGYARAGLCGRAHQLFSMMEAASVRQNVVSWNVMISGYIQNGEEERAVDLFRKMESAGIKRDAASWNALIAGSANSSNTDGALRIFRQMQFDNMKPNTVTILSILPACANLVSMAKVKEIHACVLHNHLVSDLAVSNALIDTYSKSGSFASAKTVFDHQASKDLISWNSILGACILYGRSETAVALFGRMTKEKIQPNPAIFTSMINAYGLEGMVVEGKDMLFRMVDRHNLTPMPEHYAALIDLFGRHRMLGEIAKLVENIPISLDSTIWGAVFRAARNNGDLRLSRKAAEQLLKLETADSAVYKSLSRIQTSGWKSDAKDSGKNSSFECWMEFGHKVYSFSTGSTTANLELALSELYPAVGDDMNQSTNKADGFDFDLEEEKPEDDRGTHSEKLAVTFGIAQVSSYKAKAIRVIKSVRICRSCHEFCKAVSKRYSREILIKDPKLLHVFRDGRCSCRDYW